MRLPFFAELRWLIAQQLVGWAMDLTEREMSVETLNAFGALLTTLEPRSECKTVRMQNER